MAPVATSDLSLSSSPFQAAPLALSPSRPLTHPLRPLRIVQPLTFRTLYARTPPSFSAHSERVPLHAVLIVHIPFCQFLDDFPETRFQKLDLTAAGRFTTSTLKLASLVFLLLFFCFCCSCYCCCCCCLLLLAAASLVSWVSYCYSLIQLHSFLGFFSCSHLPPNRPDPTNVRDHHHHHHYHHHHNSTQKPRPICSSLPLYGLRILSAELEYPWCR